MGSHSEQAKMAEALSFRVLGSSVENPYVLALDVGTTTIRCHVFDKYAQIKGTGSRKVSFAHFCQANIKSNLEQS